MSRFIKKAKKQLLIYDMKVSDRQMIKLLQERVKAGVDVRILGKVGKKGVGLTYEKMPGMRLHARAMLRDNQELFLGSMSLRAIELDKRREIGVIVKDRTAAKQFREIFEQDWAKTEIAKAADKSKDKDDKKAKRSPRTLRSSRTPGRLRPLQTRRPYGRASCSFACSSG